MTAATKTRSRAKATAPAAGRSNGRLEAVGVYVHPDSKKELRKIARKAGKPIAQVSREVLERWVAGHKV
jgi:uncharacterized protein with von Willebrand factor type A (vWA) domain